VVALVKVTVHYGHPLTEITGKARENVVVEKGATVLFLLKTLATKYGDAFKDYVFSNYDRYQVKEGTIISLNAKYISKETEKIRIEDDAFIGIFRAVGGG